MTFLDPGHTLYLERPTALSAPWPVQSLDGVQLLFAGPDELAKLFAVGAMMAAEPVAASLVKSGVSGALLAAQPVAAQIVKSPTAVAGSMVATNPVAAAIKKDP